MIAGFLGYSGQYACLLKLDASGNLDWIQSYGSGAYIYGYEVLQTPDGGYIFCGTQSSDAWLVKTDSQGTIEWQETYGTAQSSGAYGILQNADGGYTFCGYYGNYLTRRMYLVRTDSLGVMVWQEYHGYQYEYARDVQHTGDGGYALCGTHSSDFHLVRTDEYGNEIWDALYDYGEMESCVSVAVTSDDGFILAGETLEPPGSPYTFPNALIIKTEPCMGIYEGESVPRGISGCSVSPNPSAGYTTISFDLGEPARIDLTVYDLTGREVAVILEGQVLDGKAAVQWNGMDGSGQLLPGGIYLLHLSDGISSVARQMVLIR
jgi:hypothetical protein